MTHVAPWIKDWQPCPFAVGDRIKYLGPTVSFSNTKKRNKALKKKTGVVYKGVDGTVYHGDVGVVVELHEKPDGASIIKFPNGVRMSVRQESVDRGRFGKLP